MTKRDKYLGMRKAGMTYTAIAQKCGVSKQAVYNSIRKHHICNVKPQTVVFPGLRRWMCDNRVFVSDLERMTDRCLRQALCSGKISAQSINAIMKVTGLSYEQAFGKK